MDTPLAAGPSELQNLDTVTGMEIDVEDCDCDSIKEFPPPVYDSEYDYDWTEYPTGNKTRVSHICYLHCVCKIL